jgi:hypothetical protein
LSISVLSIQPYYGEFLGVKSGWDVVSSGGLFSSSLAVSVGVGVGVSVAFSVGVAVGVEVGLVLGVGVGVGVCIGVSVGVGSTGFSKETLRL